jgi:uncharacterized membrane protein
MKSVLLLLHLAFVGVWLGCVLTEALFERALLGRGREQELLLAHLHKRVDLVVEIPAFIAVLVTGGLMLQGASPSVGLQVKVAFGLLAIAANAYCVLLVFKRQAHASAGQWESFAQVDHLQHKVGAVVLIAILAALGIGVHLYAGA